MPAARRLPGGGAPHHPHLCAPRPGWARHAGRCCCGAAAWRSELVRLLRAGCGGTAERCPAGRGTHSAAAVAEGAASWRGGAAAGAHRRQGGGAGPAGPPPAWGKRRQWCMAHHGAHAAALPCWRQVAEMFLAQQHNYISSFFSSLPSDSQQKTKTAVCKQ